MSNKIRFGIPKGSLEKATFDSFRKAGWQISGSERSYMLQSNDTDVEFILLRPQAIPKVVERSALDAGITGKDWIVESGANVEEVMKMQYSKNTNGCVRWVLAVPVDSKIMQVSDLNYKVVSTELVNVTTDFLIRNGVENVRVEFSWGTTEILPSIGIADAIVDLTETGESLKKNNLRIVGNSVLESYTALIANRLAYADPQKRQKIDNIAMLLKGALDARDNVGLKMNVNKKDIDKILLILKSNKMYGINSPTIANLADPEWIAVEIIVKEDNVREIMPELKNAGACGIIEYSLNKFIT